MKILEKVTIVLFVLVLAAFCGFQAYDRILTDHTPPVITCDSDTIDISVSDPESALFQGITAKDNRDGDLTGSVMIKGMTGLITNDTAKVTYIVFDSANNMATCQRTVHYTDYEKPRFALSAPLIYKVEEPIIVLDKLTARDSSGQDISENIRVVAQNINDYYEGTYNLTVQVSNSLGDVESLTLPVIITEKTSRQFIELRDYLVYLNVGDGFNAYNYVKSVRDGSSELDGSNAAVQGNVDTSKPGTYYMEYTYGTYRVYLTVVVK